MSEHRNTDEAAEAFVDLFHRFRRAVGGEMSAAGLSLSRTKLLLHLTDGPVRQHTLAERLEVSPRTVTETLDALERDGLALRHDDPSDRRANLVALTARGRIALAESLQRRDRLRHEVFSVLDDSALATFTDLLRTLSGSPSLIPTRSAP